MGWWKVEGSDNLIGDEPLDALTSAMHAVIDAYRGKVGRRPTKQEWEALMHAVLGEEDEDTKPLDKGTVTSVKLEIHAS